MPFRKLPTGKPRRGLLNERYTDEKAKKGYDVIIIGSGMGGLSCAASLSRFGLTVLVLEQHDVAGGGTHTFHIDGKTVFQSLRRFQYGVQFWRTPGVSAYKLRPRSILPRIQSELALRRTKTKGSRG